MSDPDTPELPADLQARLGAAGVTDQASLQRALDADPALRDDFTAFIEQHRERLFQAALARLLDDLVAVPDSRALAELWRRVPLELEDPFIAAVGRAAAQAEQAGQDDLAAGLRQRLDSLRQLQERQREALAQVPGWAEGLAAAADAQQAGQIWQAVPLELEEPVLELLERRAAELEQAGDAAAERARGWLAALREERQRRLDPQRQPPGLRALLAFLQAESDDAAARVFAAERELLQPFETQQILEGLVAQVPDGQRERFAARAALLRTLRGAAPAPSLHEPSRGTLAGTVSFTNQQVTVGGNLNQAGQNLYINATHIESSGPTLVFNNIAVERRWTRPAAPPPERDAIVREADLGAVTALLEQRGELAISSRVAAAVQGMPGVGKTTLARQLAIELDPRYPDGVIWEELGPHVGTDDVQLILNRWARIALLIPPGQESTLVFEPGAVRALLAARPRLLVILDNVWSLPAVRPLREALPRGAHLVVTTRSRAVLFDLGGARYELRELSPADARRLIALRLGWEEVPPEENAWCDELAEGLGLHTLALDVALGLLLRQGQRAEEWRASAARVLAHVRTGQGFDNLRLEDENREHNVELVLSLSYERMDQTARRRFRLLGALAEGADWSSAAAARLWECDEESARRQLDDFVNGALLGRAEQAGRWRQHGLLRGYALALLRREGQHETAAARHAALYDGLMRAADKEQRFYQMLPEYPQLRHAFAWAVDNDLKCALSLISNTANLQSAFGLVSESLMWCKRALTAAIKHGTPVDIAHIQNSLGKAFHQMASLPDQDRPTRLHEALAAFDAALRFRTPTTTPSDYATTQNNRGNVLQELAYLPDQDRSTRLHEALSAFDAALLIFTPTTAPLDYATTQNNRGNVLQLLASLPDQDRAARLQEALAAFDAALLTFTPASTPLDYATTQNNRGNVLQLLASLPAQDRATRLQEALAAYEAALRFRTPTTVPLNYATTQNNRGTVLQELASLPAQDRAARLHEALAAYDAALRFSTPATAPLQYASTQNNRGTVLQELATLPDQDRSTRIHEALAAFDAALCFRTPTTTPLDYATTQNNRGNILQELASLPAQDRAARLQQALAAFDAALCFSTPDIAPLQYASTQNNRGTVLQELASLPDQDRSTRIHEALAAFDAALRFRTPDSAPIDYALTQSNLANLYQAMTHLPDEDQQRSRIAALQAAWTAWTIFGQVGHAPYQQQAVRQLRSLRSSFGQDFAALWGTLGVGEPPAWLQRGPDDLQQLGQQLQTAFLAVSSPQELAAFWQQIPLEQEDAFLAIVEQWIAEAQAAGSQELVQALHERLEGLRQIRAAQQALGRYAELRKAAQEAGSSAAWQATVEAGEALLAPELAELEMVNWDALRADLASAYTSLAIAHEQAQEHQAELAANERAVALQPQEAMWRRNLAGTLIGLGRLDQAGAALEQARALEPDAPRLSELEQALAAAHTTQRIL